MTAYDLLGQNVLETGGSAGIDEHHPHRRDIRHRRGQQLVPS